MWCWTTQTNALLESHHTTAYSGTYVQDLLLKGAEVQQRCNRGATEVQQSYLNDAEALLEVEAPRVREQPRRLYVYVYIYMCIHIHTINVNKLICIHICLR
jgi:hypothetical protein